MLTEYIYTGEWSTLRFEIQYASSRVTLVHNEKDLKEEAADKDVNLQMEYGGFFLCSNSASASYQQK